MSEKLDMKSMNIEQENIRKIQAIFPNAVTEIVRNGKIELAVDFNILKTELAGVLIDEKQERYQMTWPEKTKAKALAAQQITATLRPSRKESVDFDSTKNLYIEGDNLDVLKLLQETYFSKINVIYIDPPYNTGNDFIYADNFVMGADEYSSVSGDYDSHGNRLVKNMDTNGRFHTDWLNMMYPRLRVAKDLLSDDGVIFISIDDNELNNLLKVCNEIFGENNFIGCLSVENNPKGRKNSDFISVSSEYCVIYAKKKAATYFIENVPKKATDMTQDENGRYVHNSGKRVLVGENSFNKVVSKKESDKNYSVYYHRREKKILFRKENFGEEDTTLINQGYIKYYSYFNGRLVENTYTQDKFGELFAAGALDFSDSKIYEKNFSDTIRIKSQLVNREYEAIVHGQKRMFSLELTTTGAGTYLKELFGFKDVPFTAPKGVGLLKLLISLLPNKNLMVMDFFSGSATTADATMRLNFEDGGRRRYIMVQIPEMCDEKSEAYIAGYKTICDIGKERIRRAGCKIKEENPLMTQDLDIGFRVLKLDSSNMQDVYYHPTSMPQSLLDSTIDNIKPDRTPVDLLFQVMLSLGIELSAKIEEKEVAGKKYYVVNNGALIACFDDDINNDVITEIAKAQPIYVVFRDKSFANDSVGINNEQLFKTYSPATIVKVI